MPVIIDGTTKRKYLLGEGTPNEVWLEMSEEQMLTGHKQWFGHILALTAAYARGDAPHAAPLIPTIQAIFVLWQYVSFDISRLQQRNTELEEQSRLMLSRLEKLEANVVELQARATSSEPQPAE